MKKFIVLILTCLLIFSLQGCRDVVSETESEVKVKVVDSFYQSGWTQMIPHKVGKVTTFTTIYHPARYYIHVTYEGNTYEIDVDSSMYSKYLSFMNQEVLAYLICTEYDDGSTETTIRLP